MLVAEQIDMMKLLRKSLRKEAAVWAKSNLGRSKGAAYACRQYAIACTAVLKSLNRLQEEAETRL